MPTIDQLAPAASASDADELMISQAGIVRKITRAQILNGVQPQIALPGGALLGRASAGTGSPEVLAIGRNLVLNGSTLSATAAPFVITTLSGGSIPAGPDLLSISQAGSSVAITFSQLLHGISAAPNFDLSQALVTPANTTAAQKLSNFTQNMLSITGGTLTGSLGLAGSPLTSSQAANKAYVDQQVGAALPISGGTMRGILTLSSMPQSPLDSASKSYVDSVATSVLSLTGGSLAGPLLLTADPTVPGQASTKRYVDQKLSRAGDTLTGSLALASDPIAPLQAATKNYVDTQIAGAVAKKGATLSGALVLAFDPTMNAQAATKQYVDQRLARSGDTLTGSLSLAVDPTLPSHVASKRYVDAQVAGSVPRAGTSMSGALLLAGDPGSPLQASTKQYVDLRIARVGDSLTGALYLASDPIAPLQASTKQYVDGRFQAVPMKTGGTFLGPVILSSDPTSNYQAATKQYADARLLRSGDSLSGALLLASDPTVSAQATTKNYVDLQMLTRLSLGGGSISGNLTLGTGPMMPAHASTKQYVDAQVATALPIAGGTVSGALTLAISPATPLHAANKQYVDTRMSGALPLTGGALTGQLVLAGAPLLPLQAATKAYVDANPDAARVINVVRPPFGALLDGVTDDTAAFKAAYLAAAVGGVIYVPNGTTVLQQPGSWGIALTKFVKWVVDGTLLRDGTPLAAAVPAGGAPGFLVLPGVVVGHSRSGATTSRGGSQTTDFAVSQSSYIVNHTGGTSGTVASNVRSDTIIYASPGNYIWGGVDRLLWVGTQTPNAATPAQHVARYIQTIRQAATTGSDGRVLPQPELWTACLEYRDTTGQPSSATAASLTAEMDWFGNGLDDANSRTIQSLVIGQHNLAGAPVEVSNIIGVYLAAGSAGSAKTVFGIGVPFSNAVLDTTYAQQVNNAPVIKLSAGQAIAFEPTNSCRLLYDSGTNTLRWNQGTLSYAVGKGITVGWVNVYSASATLPNYISGNLIILVGTGTYSISLPAASTVAAGTGYTFSATGAGTVSILPKGTDTIDLGPITLRTNDRYHIVSDGYSSWREIFRLNAVSPRFAGPIVLPSYTVAGLPTGVTAGAKAFVSNGRKPTEGSGAGSGVEVFFDGQKWISSCSGAAVAA